MTLSVKKTLDHLSEMSKTLCPLELPLAPRKAGNRVLLPMVMAGCLLGLPLTSTAMEQQVTPEAFPHSTAGIAGGTTHIPGAIVPSGEGTPSDKCLGFAAVQANHHLQLSTPPPVLTLTVDSFGANIDTTLAVKTPDGEWFCGDDGNGTEKDATLTLNAPTAGEYQIWVGTFDGGYVDYELILD